MNMTKWNEFIIHQHLLLGWEQASLIKAQMAIDQARIVLEGLVW